jgi:hypothetical protein
MQEEWRIIPGFSDYEASSHGRIRAIKTNKILNPYKSKAGYLETNLSVNKKPVQTRVHRLIALAFIGECPIGFCVHHRDKNKSNNYYKNLLYVDRKKHLADYHKLLSDDEIEEMRHLYLNHVSSVAELAKVLDIEQSMVYRYAGDLVEKYESYSD